MTVIVTGGAGFIGSALVRSLLKEGARRVLVIDNLLTGRESNLEEVRSSVDFQRADIRNYEEIAPLIRGAAVVFHEAAIPSVPRSIERPRETHDASVNGTFALLLAARDAKVRRVIYAASSSAYGDQRRGPAAGPRRSARTRPIAWDGPARQSTAHGACRCRGRRRWFAD